MRAHITDAAWCASQGLLFLGWASTNSTLPDFGVQVTAL
jgi:hypothetical protein